MYHGVMFEPIAYLSRKMIEQKKFLAPLTRMPLKA